MRKTIDTITTRWPGAYLETFLKEFPEMLPKAFSETFLEVFPEKLPKSFPEAFSETFPEAFLDAFLETFPEAFPEAFHESFPKALSVPCCPLLNSPFLHFPFRALKITLGFTHDQSTTHRVI